MRGGGRCLGGAPEAEAVTRASLPHGDDDAWALRGISRVVLRNKQKPSQMQGKARQGGRQAARRMKAKAGGDLCEKREYGKRDKRKEGSRSWLYYGGGWARSSAAAEEGSGMEGRGGEVQQLLLQQRLCQAHATGSPGVLEGRPGRVGGCGWLRLAGTGE